MPGDRPMVTSPMPPVPAVPEQPATIFVALELSKARWLVGIHTPVADKISRHGVAGGDSRALLELIARARRRNCTKCTARSSAWCRRRRARSPCTRRTKRRRA